MSGSGIKISKKLFELFQFFSANMEWKYIEAYLVTMLIGGWSVVWHILVMDKIWLCLVIATSCPLSHFLFNHTHFNEIKHTDIYSL